MVNKGPKPITKNTNAFVIEQSAAEPPFLTILEKAPIVIEPNPPAVYEHQTIPTPMLAPVIEM